MENSEEIRQCGNDWRYCDGDCANCPAGKTFTTDRTVEHGMSSGEALARLKRMYAPLVYGVPMDPRGEEAQNFEAICMAISALKKQEGKKPLQACGHATELFKRDIPLMNYCPICGQKIDWSE